MSSRQESEIARLERLLREADERAEQERRRAEVANKRVEQEQTRAEDERRNRKEADQRAEQERRRAEVANKRVEQEQTRAEDERRNRKEADQRAEQERRRAEVANKRVEQAQRYVEDEQRNRQEAQSRAQIERTKTRRTTFKEYIRACHTLLSKPLCIQTDKRRTTQGSITSYKNKPCPTLLKPWTDFPALQQQLFERLYEYIPRDTELFSSIQYLTELGHDLCDRPLASEKDLEVYQRLAVERPITHIISHLQQIEEARHEFNLGDGLIFENHTNTLSDNNEDVQQSLQDQRTLSKGQALSSNPKPRNADQICVYKETDGTRSLCLVVEYKPSHKLTVFNLRAGLSRADKGSMNVLEDVINRITIPTDPDKKFVYNSELLIAAALIQIYGYMIESGLEYSYLVTAESFVFLWIKEDEPHTLYYHLAEPNFEAEAQEEIDILLCRTAISQTLTFCLFALRSKPRGQFWRNQTLQTASRAIIDYEAILRQIPAEEKALTPPTSVFHARIHPFKRSPIMLRSKKRKARNSCDWADTTANEDPQCPSSSSDETSDVETPSKPKARLYQSNTQQLRSAKPPQAAKESDVLQYCTQACLLGLARKHPLDNACPNVRAHRVHGAGNYHALGRKTVAKLVFRQLAKDPDDGCKPLGKQGACGALFGLTLESYGYTFVAKGTVTAYEAKLRHEGLVYQHLDKVQGELIPVYLGNISLVRPYFLDFGVRIVHMLLMSWAGVEARKDLIVDVGRDLAKETSVAVTRLLDCGVEHRDVRPPNVLWNSEAQKVMLVDFERSEILKQMPILQEISPNRKREYLHFADGHTHKASDCGQTTCKCSTTYVPPRAIQQ